jgi:hypothetical protein
MIKEKNLNLKNESVILDTKTSIFNTNKKILISLKDKRKIPILETEELKGIEEKASDLAYFLQVPLKGN